LICFNLDPSYQQNETTTKNNIEKVKQTQRVTRSAYPRKYITQKARNPKVPKVTYVTKRPKYKRTRATRKIHPTKIPKYRKNKVTRRIYLLKWKKYRKKTKSMLDCRNELGKKPGNQAKYRNMFGINIKSRKL